LPAAALYHWLMQPANRCWATPLTPEPKPVIIGIAAPEGRLTPAAEKFWQCAKQAAAAAANSRR
jgi:hypothetical protein